jgi:CspA family cold shock protein
VATRTNEKKNKQQLIRMETGTVKFFNASKGYGFIKADSGEEVFVHATGLADASGTLKENDKVEFEIGEGKRGPTALKVKKV